MTRQLAASADRGEAVQHGNTDPELHDLTVEVPRHGVPALQFHTVHLGLCMASAVIAAPPSPDSSTDALRCAQGVVARDRTLGDRLPRPGILARQYDGIANTSNDGVMALMGVVGTVGSDVADLSAGRDLVQKLGQHGRVATSQLMTSTVRLSTVCFSISIGGKKKSQTDGL